MTDAKPNQAAPRSVSLPIVMVSLGVLLIGLSFFPIGKWAARSQWTTEDSAAYDRLGNEFKQSAYRSPARAGLSDTEWKAQREKMKQQIDVMQRKLARAKQQPKRWSRYVLGLGVLLTAAGFFASSSRKL